MHGHSATVYIPQEKLSLEPVNAGALEVHDSRGETEEVNNTKSINPEKFSVFFWIKRLAESTRDYNITFKLY